jgi:hypothetical protein
MPWNWPRTNSHIVASGSSTIAQAAVQTLREPMAISRAGKPHTLSLPSCRTSRAYSCLRTTLTGCPARRRDHRSDNATHGPCSTALLRRASSRALVVTMDRSVTTIDVRGPVVTIGRLPS